eukprot:COSAG04_NODE_683_length_11182_cov_15.270775_9_plen_192_part_00
MSMAAWQPRTSHPFSSRPASHAGGWLLYPVPSANPPPGVNPSALLQCSVSLPSSSCQNCSGVGGDVAPSGLHSTLVVDLVFPPLADSGPHSMQKDRATTRVHKTTDAQQTSIRSRGLHPAPSSARVHRVRRHKLVPVRIARRYVAKSTLEHAPTPAPVKGHPRVCSPQSLLPSRDPWGPIPPHTAVGMAGK